jgi:outer membrane lipoprotein-sorting protein
MRYFLLFLLLTGAEALPLRSETLNPKVIAWLNAQTNVQSWTADFVQTRMLKSLSQPLSATGHVWFAAPNRFRWELGKPAQTIAVKSGEKMQIIYPRLKRVEVFDMSGQAGGQWREALSLLEAGFPRTQADVENRYNILSQSIEGNVCHLHLQPKSAGARQIIPTIKIEFDTSDQVLKATEIESADGSTMRNDFSHPELNVPVDEKVFSPEPPAGYKVVNPLSQAK